MLTLSNRPRRGTTQPSPARVVARAVPVSSTSFTRSPAPPRAGGAEPAALAGANDVYWGTRGERPDSRETRRPDGPVAREFGSAEMPAGEWRQKQ